MAKQHFPEQPEFAVQFAESFVRSALTMRNIRLDYSRDSLSSVEQIMDSLHRDGAPKEAIPDLLFCIGCYLGEVLVRLNQAVWVHAHTTPLASSSSSALVLAMPLQGYCNPIDAVANQYGKPAAGAFIHFLDTCSSEQRPAMATESQAENSEEIKYLKQHAAKGDAAAQFRLGEYYEQGHGLSQDYVQAVYWYTQAAEQGYSFACCNLADKYEHGLGVEQDEAKALVLYQQAADKDIAAAWYSLGLMHFDGRGTPKDLAEAIRCMRQASKYVPYYDDAKEQLARMERLEEQQRLTQTRVLLSRTDASAEELLQTGLAVLGIDDQDVPKLAATAFLRAAELGNAEAQYQLGWILERGVARDADADEILDWYQRAGKQGNVEAWRRLAELYTTGGLVAPNPERAARYAREALRCRQAATTRGAQTKKPFWKFW